MSKNPLRTIVIGFLTVIVVGTIMLMLPISTNGGISLINALFTATSAVCVTGLVVVSMSHFTLFGQIVVLLLIQIGGFGYMSLTSFVLLSFKRKLTHRDKLILKEAFNYPEMYSVVGFFKRIMIFALLSEFLGFILLSIVFVGKYSVARGLYLALFHSVSAFNNAGFSLFPDSFVSFKFNLLLNLTIMFLIILGGLGFIVVDEFLLYMKKKVKFFSLHLKVVFLFTAFLIFLPAFLIYFLEFKGILRGYGFFHGFLISLFQSITTRTAGFNTIDLSFLHNSTLFLMVVLMFIGASPGGTGGGVKTTVAATVALAIYSYIRGEREVVAFKRKIPDEVVYKSFVIVVLSFFIVSIAAFALSDIESVNFLSALFESVSALSTVGLSVSTTNLSLSASFDTFGKLLIIFLMFAGRIGLFSFSVALFRKRSSRRYSLPAGRIFV